VNTVDTIIKAQLLKQILLDSTYNISVIITHFTCHMCEPQKRIQNQNTKAFVKRYSPAPYACYIHK